MRAGLVSACLASVIVLACGRARLDPFPTGSELPGWSRGRVREFPASELWRYINGDAERYLRAGIERTFTAEYRQASGLEAVADVHLMRTADAARQIFESEPAAGSQPAGVGEEGRHYGASITFRRGRCFVRLVAYGEPALSGPALLELAKGIDLRLQRLRP